MSGWQIAMNGVNAAAGSASVNLSGTSGSPNVDQDFALNDIATAGWRFQSSGDLARYDFGIYNKPEWYGRVGSTTHQTPPTTYYLRATLDSGDSPSLGTLNTWQALSSSRTYAWEAGPGFDVAIGTIKVEIATDSGGTNIVATGYYRGSASSEF
jgi:hypothetical protein